MLLVLVPKPLNVCDSVWDWTFKSHSIIVLGIELRKNQNDLFSTLDLDCSFEVVTSSTFSLDLGLESL